MAIQQKEIELNGDKFLITTFPAMKGMNYLKRLTRLVGPAMMAANGEVMC